MAFSLTHYADVMSDLLTIREKGVLVSIIKPRYQLVKSTVVQVLQACSTPGEKQSWDCFASGVLCLVKDQPASSYFLHLYCVMREELLWEQELRATSEYTVSRPYFHIFQAGVQQFGLNFANYDEAGEFHLAVMEAQERKPNQMTQNETTTSSFVYEEPDSEYQSEVALNGRKDFPVEAQSNTENEEMRAFVDLDPAIERVLVQAGLRKEDLKDKDVSEAVDLVFTRFGGVKAVQQELKKAASQTLPRRAGGSGSSTQQGWPLIPHTKHPSSR